MPLNEPAVASQKAADLGIRYNGVQAHAPTLEFLLMCWLVTLTRVWPAVLLLTASSE